MYNFPLQYYKKMSTYATSAGNQAYNSFIEDAYNNLPEYYQMAMEAYQMEGDEMYRQLGMYTDADEREYNRNVTAYDATLNYRNMVYNEAYGEYRDTKSDAFASANLQLNEYGQRVENAYNLYNIASDYEGTLYERSYNEWMDGINQAWNVINTQNNEAWKNKEYDRAVYESDRAYNQTETWNQKDLDYKYDALKQDDEQFKASLKQDNDQFYASLNAKGSGSGSGGSDLSKTDVDALKDVYIKAGGGKKGFEAVDSYLSSIGKNNLSDEAKKGLKTTLEGTDVPVYYPDWTISDDTYNGGWFFGTNWLGGGDDKNDVYSNGSKSMTFAELKTAIEASDLPENVKKEKINALKKQSTK